MLHTEASRPGCPLAAGNRPSRFCSYLCVTAPALPQIIADRVGNLFKKESLLEYLIQKARGERSIPAFSHIRSMKDVVELKLTPNPEYAPEAARCV